VALGTFHSIAVNGNGDLLCWGRTSEGQCDLPSQLNSMDQYNDDLIQIRRDKDKSRLNKKKKNTNNNNTLINNNVENDIIIVNIAGGNGHSCAVYFE